MGGYTQRHVARRRRSGRLSFSSPKRFALNFYYPTHTNPCTRPHTYPHTSSRRAREPSSYPSSSPSAAAGNDGASSPSSVAAAAAAPAAAAAAAVAAALVAGVRFSLRRQTARTQPRGSGSRLANSTCVYIYMVWGVWGGGSVRDMCRECGWLLREGLVIKRIETSVGWSEEQLTGYSQYIYYLKTQPHYNIARTILRSLSIYINISPDLQILHRGELHVPFPRRQPPAVVEVQQAEAPATIAATVVVIVVVITVVQAVEIGPVVVVWGGGVSRRRSVVAYIRSIHRREPAASMGRCRNNHPPPASNTRPIHTNAHTHL
jgi:hypothetical protein